MIIKCEQENEHVIEKSPKGQIISSRTKYSTAEYIIGVIGVPGLLAIMIVLSLCTIIIFQAVREKPVEVPQHLTDVVTLVLGYYFGSKGRDAVALNEKSKQAGFKP